MDLPSTFFHQADQGGSGEHAGQMQSSGSPSHREHTATHFDGVNYEESLPSFQASPTQYEKLGWRFETSCRGVSVDIALTFVDLEQFLWTLEDMGYDREWREDFEVFGGVHGSIVLACFEIYR